MKRFLLMTVSALLTALVLVGCDQSTAPRLPWETPMGYEVRMEMGLNTYVNQEFRFVLDYPNIFSAVEDMADGTGMTAFAPSAQLKTWHEPLAGRSIKEIYEDAAEGIEAAEGTLNGKYFDTALYINFVPEKSEDQVGYSYMMVSDEDVYGYTFLYPSKDLATFENYCDIMHKRLLTWRADSPNVEKVANFVEAQKRYEEYIAKNGSSDEAEKLVDKP